MEPVKSVVKAANILEIFLASKKVITLGEIAKSTNLNKSTVNRIVFTLVRCGFLKQQKKRGKYTLGVRFLDFSEFIKAGSKGGLGAVPYLVELSRLVNVSVYLIIWRNTDIMYDNVLDYFQGSGEVIPYDWTDKPLHSTCVGKIILASMSNEGFQKYLRSSSTGKSSGEVEQITESIQMVRRDGLAIEEHKPGISSIAMGIRNEADEITGAIFLTGSSTHLNHAMITKSIPTLKICALKLSKDLGYQAMSIS
jgi:IclR family transcriptional regulator, KDG regulon repressor